MVDSADTLAAIQAAAIGTPYRVEPTERGFTVGLDIVNAQWWQMWAKAGLSRAYSVDVVLHPGKGTAVLTDHSQEVRWSAGVPSLGGRISKQSGRTYSFQAGKAVGVRGDGTLGEIYNYRFNSQEVRGFVEQQLKLHGWKIALPGVAKGALWVGIGTIVLMILGFGVIAVTQLL